MRYLPPMSRPTILLNAVRLWLRAPGALIDDVDTFSAELSAEAGGAYVGRSEAFRRAAVLGMATHRAAAAATKANEAAKAAESDAK